MALANLVGQLFRHQLYQKQKSQNYHYAFKILLDFWAIQILDYQNFNLKENHSYFGHMSLF